MPTNNPEITHTTNAHFTTTNTVSDAYEIRRHDFYELYYFVTGNADYLVEGKEYHLTPHSLLLLSPNTFHGVRVNSREDYTRCAIHFLATQISPERHQLLLDTFPGNTKGYAKEVFYEHTESFGLYDCLIHLIDSQSQPAPLPGKYNSIFLEALLARISLMCQSLIPTPPETIVPDTITEIIGYLNRHLTEHITLDLLSDRFYISKYYMNRAFKKATGTTVIDYLIYKRVIFARHLLLNGSTAVQAGISAGFGDYSTFYRAYRKIMGGSPTNVK